MSTVELAPVIKTVDVARSAEDAFRIFTAETSAWWPMKKHSRAKDAAGETTVSVVLEPRVGGRVYETLNTGEEREWGEVLAYEPGARVVFTMQMGRPKAESAEVEVLFEPLSAGTCRVTLTHAHWERMGADAEKMRTGYANGWVEVFDQSFADYAGRA